MAAETDEFRDHLNRLVDRTVREGTFDGVTRRFYGGHGASGVRDKSKSPVLDTVEQFKAIDAYLGRMKDRMEAIEADLARIRGRMHSLERSVMNVPGESE